MRQLFHDAPLHDTALLHTFLLPSLTIEYYRRHFLERYFHATAMKRSVPARMRHFLDIGRTAAIDMRFTTANLYAQPTLAHQRHVAHAVNTLGNVVFIEIYFLPPLTYTKYRLERKARYLCRAPMPIMASLLSLEASHVLPFKIPATLRVLSFTALL